MTMWARIENGAVAEITAIDPNGRFHPSFQWEVCATEVAAGWLYDGALFVAPTAPVVTVGELCAQIDAAADSARAQVAGDPLRAVEYQLAATEAQAFAAAGYPAEAVPRTVAAWAINGRTAQQAADNILTEAAQYNEALYLLRETRLQAKEQVRQAMDAGQAAQAQGIAAATIAAIHAAVAGIGNNPN